MPIFLKKRRIKKLFISFSIIFLFLCILLAFYNLWLSILSLILFTAFFFVLFQQERTFQDEAEKYISTLSYRVRKVGEEALLEMPIGILLIDDDFNIEWANSYMASCLKENSLIGRSLYDVADALVPIMKQEVESEKVNLYDHQYRVIYKKEEKLLYFFDITDQAIIEKKYNEERPVIAVIYLDNYDEVTQGMDDQARGSLNSRVTSLLKEWATHYGIYLKRISSDRYIAFFNEKILELLEKDKFSILDEVKENIMTNNIPLTFSIGVGAGVSDLPELGSYAQSSLDLALGRGGDQVAIKLPNGKVKFYGGKTNPMEKRTRVRARVISLALKELVEESSRIFIMGHKYPDMDAIGASIGVLKLPE